MWSKIKDWFILNIIQNGRPADYIIKCVQCNDWGTYSGCNYCGAQLPEER